MARPSSLTLAKPKILAHFAKTGPKVYAEAELAGMLISEAARWSLVKTTSITDFISLLKQSDDFKVYIFRSDGYDRTITRYAWGNVSPHALALSLKSRGYLSHGTAAHLHNLLKIKLKTIYLNVEQSPKPAARGGLTQNALKLAFSRKQRQSNYTFRHGSHSVTIIAGKNTGQLGVETLQSPKGDQLQITNLERTLIDVTVRPAYAGGVDAVLKAYRAARNHVSVERLLNILDELAYVYPYHQSIGFLMQAAGYNKRDYGMLAARPKNYDFYLAHGIEDPEYFEAWRLYYPRDLIIGPNAGQS